MAQTALQFQQAAQRQDPAVFDFEAEVAQIWQDFPVIKDRIFFLDATNFKLVYPSHTAKKEEALRLVSRLGVEELHDEHEARFGKTAHVAYWDDVQLLFLYKEKLPFGVLDRAASVAQETVLTFDHESGHILVPYEDIYETEATPDNCADAWAVIRHLQRYGTDSPTIDAIVANRAFSLIFREPDYGRAHFTSPVTEAILARRHEIDWDSLKSAQTVQTARDFVREHQVRAGALHDLDISFRTLHNKAQDIEKGDTTPVKALAEKLLATDSAAVFKYGMMALQVCQEKQNLTGAQWDNVRKDLAKKQQSFTQPERPPVKLSVGLG